MTIRNLAFFLLLGALVPQTGCNPQTDPHFEAVVNAQSAVSAAAAQIDTALAAVPVDQQTDPYFAKLARVLGANDFGDAFVNQHGGNGDVDDESEGVVAAASAGAYADLQDLLNQMAGSRNEKQKLSDAVSAYNNLLGTLVKAHQDYLQFLLAQPRANGGTKSRSLVIPLAAGISGTTDIVEPGDLAVGVDCGGSAVPIQAEIIDLVTRAVITSKTTRGGSVSMNSQTASTRAIQINVSGQALNPVPCTLSVSRSTRGGEHAITLSPATLRDLQSRAAQLSDLRQQFIAEVSRLRDAQLVDPAQLDAVVAAAAPIFAAAGEIGGATDIADLADSVKNKLDSLSEMGETESLRLQMAMDRLSKLMSTLSNLLKKVSDTSTGITQNMK